MIRMLFAMFVTLAGFAAAALWMARGGDAREVVAEILPVEVRSAVRSELRAAVEQFDFQEVASRLPGAAPKGGAPGDSSAAADPGDAAEPETAELAEEAVEVRDLPPRGEFPRDLGAAADDGAGEEEEEETASARSWGDGAAPLREPDQDAQASLIRRMLAVYHQTGAIE
jgi:hypothetical protein